MRSPLNPLPHVRVVRGAKAHGALKMFMQPKAGLVSGFGSAVHGQCDVPDFGFIYSHRPQNSEEG